MIFHWCHFLSQFSQLSSVAATFSNLQETFQDTIADFQSATDFSTQLAAFGRFLCGGDRQLFKPNQDDQEQAERNANTQTTVARNDDPLARVMARDKYLRSNYSKINYVQIYSNAINIPYFILYLFFHALAKLPSKYESHIFIYYFAICLMCICCAL